MLSHREMRQGGKKHDNKARLKCGILEQREPARKWGCQGCREAGTGEIVQVPVDHAHNNRPSSFLYFPCYSLHL